MKLELITHTPKGASKGNLLFVHGICTGAWIWDEHFLPFFAQHGYTAHAVSLRGHGQSEGAQNLPFYTLQHYTTDLHNTLDKLGTDKPLTLIGHSLGGAVVQSVLQTGGKVHAAALMASVPPWGLAHAAWRMAISTPLLFHEVTKMQTLGIESTNPQTLREGLFSPDAPASVLTNFESKVQNESRVIGAELQGLRPFAPMPWQAPKMGIFGAANDKFIPADEVLRTATYYGTEAHIIANMAHSMMLDTRWPAAAESLLTWLES
ncbi:MAG: alpha/beta hydrolase [Pseudomonas fluorescens]|nr:MAG: alpha/beta hydrolase [Pseudomonas fluorescens]